MNISGISNYQPPSPDTRSSNLDVDKSGRVTFNDLVKYKGAPILETAEPNTPFVDDFDVNRDGFVTNFDISEKLSAERAAASSRRIDSQALSERIAQLTAAASKHKDALATLSDIQSGDNKVAVVDVKA